MNVHRSTRLATLAALLLALGTTTAPAEKCLRSIWIDTLRNNCWPQPFLQPDRYATRVPFHLMVHNGWRRQNMLASQHFQTGTTELTEAGKLKVKWILREAPPQHRTIYVQVADSAEETAARRAAVAKLAAQIAPGGPRPEIQETTASYPGWPARHVDAIGRKFESAIPDPVLPAADAGGDSWE